MNKTIDCTANIAKAKALIDLYTPKTLAEVLAGAQHTRELISALDDEGKAEYREHVIARRDADWCDECDDLMSHALTSILADFNQEQRLFDEYLKIYSDWDDFKIGAHAYAMAITAATRKYRQRVSLEVAGRLLC